VETANTNVYFARRRSVISQTIYLHQTFSNLATEKNLLVLPEIEIRFLDRPARRLLTILTELSEQRLEM
jgi:hypothetical protein